MEPLHLYRADSLYDASKTSEKSHQQVNTRPSFTWQPVARPSVNLYITKAGNYGLEWILDDHIRLECRRYSHSMIWPFITDFSNFPIVSPQAYLDLDRQGDSCDIYPHRDLRSGPK
jgi:hypothetical protein